MREWSMLTSDIVPPAPDSTEVEWTTIVYILIPPAISQRSASLTRDPTRTRLVLKGISILEYSRVRQDVYFSA